MEILRPLILMTVAVTLLMPTESKAMNEVRTFMSYTLPVDPAKIQSIPDMDMSYALAGTLVEWDSDKQISAGLAETWRIVSPNTYRFRLQEDARWSNGEAVTSEEIKRSFDRGITAHPQDLRSLAQMLDSIECPSPREVDFKLKIPAHESGLLEKLTEPNYGILKIVKGKPDLSKTTGPFYLVPSDSSQLTLQRNSEWHRFESEVPSPQRVIIRKPPKGMDSQNILLSDPWPTLIETSSLISAETLKRYESERFEIWRRPVDKFFHLHLGKRSANADGRALVRYLRQQINAADFVVGLSGFTLAAQIFPRGYRLYDPEFSCHTETPAKLPLHFQTKPIDVLISPARVTPVLKENIRRVLLQATGINPNFISVPLEQVPISKVKGDFDLYAGTVGMADPDPEGIMSFFLESDAPLIHSTPQNGGHAYLERLDAARKEKDTDKKHGLMRSILSDAVCSGDMLPLFHLSTIGIGRRELDFSNIPSSDESVTLSKIRFRHRDSLETQP